MKSRRKSREYALQVLFQTEFEPSLSADQALALFRTTFSFDDTSTESARQDNAENWNFTTDLIHGVFDNLEHIDDVIQGHSTHWKLDRMAIVDRNVLRIGVFEILYRAGDVPPKVVIDEAIEIAKTFGSSDSGSFINGILDTVQRLS